jgi:hypothetical protein
MGQGLEDPSRVRRRYSVSVLRRFLNSVVADVDAIHVCSATSIQAEGRDVVLLADAAGRLSLVSYASREGPSKPIVRSLGVVRHVGENPYFG